MDADIPVALSPVLASLILSAISLKESFASTVISVPLIVMVPAVKSAEDFDA
jgi:hypothetical protein